MQLILQTAPTSEPITIAELKHQLNLDSETFDGNLELTQSLAFASHAIAANYTTHVGTGVDVLGHEAVVIVHAGTNGATGTVDTKIQEADVLAGPYTDWTGGAFDQVTTANDNADYKKEYTGTKQYIRTASKVLLAACEFGTSVLVNEATVSDESLLTSILQASREHVEDVTRRALITQTWDYYINDWPSCDYIKIPFGNLQSVTSVSWQGTDGTETTLTETTDYLVETNGDEIGRLVLPYGDTWPSGTLYPSNPIKIRFLAGWTAASSIPEKIKSAIKMICTDMYQNRESQLFTVSGAYLDNPTAMKLIYSSILWDEF